MGAAVAVGFALADVAGLTKGVLLVTTGALCVVAGGSVALAEGETLFVLELGSALAAGAWVGTAVATGEVETEGAEVEGREGTSA